ncbi:arginine and glutamate-rich protein 1-A [Penaeus vannamei]|uniref:arginine and glutamate-rich protein 1-A n=1 Tax=Penaeus vannamei TaxID=6689 RepID=UPI00387F8C71
MGSRRSTRFSKREKTLFSNLVKGKELSTLKFRQMNPYLRQEQKAEWAKILVAFNAAGTSKTLTIGDMKRLWGKHTRRVLQESALQRAQGIGQSEEPSQDPADKSNLPLPIDECESQDAQGIGQNEEPSQDQPDRSGLPPHADGIDAIAGVSLVSENEQKTLAEVPVQSSTAAEEIVDTFTNTDDGKEEIAPPLSMERTLWQVQLKMLETQAKIEHAQLKSLERQAKIEEAQLQSLERHARIEEAQFRCLERQIRLNDAKLKVHDKKVKVMETLLGTLERQAKVDGSHLKILQSQVKMEAK